MRHVSGTSFENSHANDARNKVYENKIRRKEAIERGLNVYYSDKECEHCGNGKVRYTTSSACVICRNGVKKPKGIDVRATERRRKIEDIRERDDLDYYDSLLSD